MIYQYLKPSQILSPFIKHFWILEENNPSGEVCIPRMYPTGFTELVFYYGDRYLHIDKNKSKTPQPYSYFMGQNNSYYDISPTGKIGVIAITFKPDTAKLFFKTPIDEAENSFIALEDIIGKFTRNLEYELQIAKSNIDRIRLIEKFLINQLKKNYSEDHKRIGFSVDKINQSKGLISIVELADFACLSTKQFNRKFTEFVGIKPKQFTRVVRFQNTIYSQQRRSVKNLTELAYKCGYYDQAHFTNEFKEFTGYSPKEFFKTCEPYSDYFS